MTIKMQDGTMPKANKINAKIQISFSIHDDLIFLLFSMFLLGSR
jgi:hypothetical protein